MTLRRLLACLCGGAAALSATTTRSSASARTNLMQILAQEMPGQRFTAGRDGAKRIEEAVAALEAAATEEERPSFPRDLMVLDGEWDLKFTNNAPPPPPDWVPVDASNLAGRDVVQRIDVLRRRVVNCVSIAPWPAGDVLENLPLVGGPLAALSRASVRLELDHSFSVDGDGSSAGARRAAGTNRVAISFEKLDRTLSGLDYDAAPIFSTLLPEQSSYDVPEPIRAVNEAVERTALGGGLFDTTFCDETLRISRGSNPLRPEVRVFTRAAAPAPPPAVDEDRYAPMPPDMEGDPDDDMPSD